MVEIEAPGLEKVWKISDISLIREFQRDVPKDEWAIRCREYYGPGTITVRLEIEGHPSPRYVAKYCPYKDLQLRGTMHINPVKRIILTLVAGRILRVIRRFK